jgi:hypothetical protein
MKNILIFWMQIEKVRQPNLKASKYGVVAPELLKFKNNWTSPKRLKTPSRCQTEVKSTTESTQSYFKQTKLDQQNIIKVRERI